MKNWWNSQVAILVGFEIFVLPTFFHANLHNLSNHPALASRDDSVLLDHKECIDVIDRLIQA